MYEENVRTKNQKCNEGRENILQKVKGNEK